MKIAWFTPFTRKSAIGYYSKLATEAINMEYDIDIWVSKRDGDNLHESELNIIRYEINSELNILRSYDYLIFNLGNCYEYHADIYKVLCKYKGIIILHDVVMHNFFMGVWLLENKDSNSYISYLNERYGLEAKEKAVNSFKGKIVPPFWETEQCAAYPMIEKSIENAIGIIVHSNYHYNTISPYYGGIISKINFPFEHLNYNIKSEIENKKEKLELLTFGQVNRNKLIHKVIKAIGTNDLLKNNIIYNIVGSLGNNNYVEELRALITKYKLTEVVHLLGYRNDENLKEYINNADILVNLRYPAFEGASWSLLEQMSMGKMIVASETGCYMEIPDDCIEKVLPGKEEEEISKILTTCYYNRDIIAQFGNNVKKYALIHYNANNYLNNFKIFIKKMDNMLPIENVINKIINELKLFSINKNMKIINKCEDILMDFFD